MNRERGMGERYTYAENLIERERRRKGSWREKEKEWCINLCRHGKVESVGCKY